MKGFTGGALLIIAVGWMLWTAGCQAEQRREPQRRVLNIMDFIPEDGQDTIAYYIDSQHIERNPVRAVGAFNLLARRAKDSAEYAVMKCYEGQAWEILQLSDSILACYEAASLYLEAHPELIDYRTMSYLNSGKAHYYKNNRLTANYYFNKAGNELEDTQYVKGGHEYVTSSYSLPDRVELLSYIASNAQEAGLQEQSRHYIQRALHAARQLGGRAANQRALPLVEAGLIFTLANKPDSGAAMFAQALPLIYRMRDTAMLVKYYNNRGKAFLAMNKYDSSLAVYQFLMQLQDSSARILIDVPDVAEGIAASYIGLRRHREAKQAIDIAYPDLYADWSAPVTERLDFTRTYLRYLVHGQRAASVFERFVAQSDSVFDIQRLNAISDMDAQYQLQKKEARILRLNEENKSYSEQVATQEQLHVVFILIIAFLGASVAFLQQFQRRRRLESERNKAVLEQQLLRSQMEPHFIFNTLSVLQSLVRKNERDLSIKYLSKFARLLRISLENARQALVPVSEEVQALEHYLSLQQIRFRDVFSYSIDTYEGYEEEASGLLIPPMLLQPFVENAVQHGMAGMKEQSGMIRISIEKIANDLLRVTIEDNGTDEAQPRQKDPSKKSSLSTTITRERLALLSTQSGIPASLDIRKRPSAAGGGMLVTLIIPFQ